MNLERMFYTNLLNPVMRVLLRSPLHGITSRNIAILHFRGRKSGRELETPLSYTREGSTVRLLSSQNTNWWINLRGAAVPVSVEIGRERRPGRAQLFEGDSPALREGVRRFLKALPRDARVYGIELDSNREPVETSLASAAPNLILVEIELD